MTDTMMEKFATLWPEMVLLIGGTICLMTGLSRCATTRKASAWIAALSLIVAAVCVCMTGQESATHPLGMAGMTGFIKLATLAIGLILLLVVAGVPGQLRQTRDAEAAKEFEPANVMRGEFFAFFLFSLTGMMLCAGAEDLVWLFLALELTSLPTYVMVASGRDRLTAQEAAVKYFFLGAMSAAIFLYGFTLIYGATGATDFTSISRAVEYYMVNHNGQLPGLFLMGLVLAVIGICFKIAAVPMHFYAADVYQGATTSVTAFLAFVPKTSGFIALMLLFGLVGWTHGPTHDQLPALLMWMLWIIAAATMTVGNVMGLLQSSVKRTLAYSSVAHSGYILVGLIAGPGLIAANQTGAIGNGLGAILFYLVAYGLATIGAFAALGCITAKHEEADSYADISGLVRSHPVVAGILVLSVLSLLGMPPLIGFLGKIYLFGSAFRGGYVVLVVVALLNSAISAGYYLHIASVCVFGEPAEDIRPAVAPGRHLGAAIAAIAALVLGLAAGGLVDSARDATRPAVPGSDSPTAATQRINSSSGEGSVKSSTTTSPPASRS
jgi:NADH-quinone oxidoreductase subunit N